MGWLRLVGSLKITGPFLKRALQTRRYSAKETYNFKEPANRSHPIGVQLISAAHCQGIPIYNICIYIRSLPSCSRLKISNPNWNHKYLALWLLCMAHLHVLGLFWRIAGLFGCVVRLVGRILHRSRQSQKIGRCWGNTGNVWWVSLQEWGAGMFIYIQMQVFIYICIYVHTYMYICNYICIYVYMYVYIYIYIYIHTYICMNVYIYKYIHMHMYIYTYIYKHMHLYVYKHSCASFL